MNKSVKRECSRLEMLPCYSIKQPLVLAVILMLIMQFDPKLLCEKCSAGAGSIRSISYTLIIIETM